MEQFLKAAAIAWNPIGEARRRMDLGSLTVGSVLVPYLSIVISCNLFFVGAQEFFFETLYAVIGGELPEHPLTNSDYALRLLSVILVLVPAGAVSLLPSGTFEPADRSATVAAILIVAAGWAFYGAAFGVPVYFLAGTLVTVDPELGVNTLFLLSIPMTITVAGLTIFFWFRTMLSVLQLSGASVAVITAISLISGAMLVGFFSFVILASTS